jgi:NADH-quinone oxidoreductase subunit J
MVELVLFWSFAFITVVTSVGVVIARNPLHSALSLIGSFFALAGLYVLLGAHLLAALQILVYAGAVMVLFIFVIMLLNLKEEELGTSKTTAMKLLGGVGIAGGGALLTAVGLRNYSVASGSVVRDLGGEPGFGTVEAVGRLLYSTYLLPFEVTSLLLLVAIVAAVVVAKARI